MSKFLVSVIAALFLISCSVGPKVLYTLKTDEYVAVFYDQECHNTKVLSIAKDMGKPDDVVLKQGKVDFTDKTPSREFCYVEFPGKVAFIIDEMGGSGNVHLPD